MYRIAQVPSQLRRELLVGGTQENRDLLTACPPPTSQSRGEKSRVLLLLLWTAPQLWEETIWNPQDFFREKAYLHENEGEIL